MGGSGAVLPEQGRNGHAAIEKAILITGANRGIGLALAKAQRRLVDRRLLLMHALVAGMQNRWRDAYYLQRLARP